MKSLRSILLAAAFALAAAAPASAQNFLINPCGGSDTCFGTGNARDAFISVDGVKRLRLTFAGTSFEPMVDDSVSLGSSTRRFKNATFSGTVTAGTISGALSGAFADGSAAAPSITFTSDPNTGFYRSAADVVSVASNGVQVGSFFQGSAGGNIATDVLLLGMTDQDVILRRDAANTLAQRNGTNAQTFNVYGTFTDTSNYRKGYITNSGGNIFIGRAAEGTGQTNGNISYGNFSAGTGVVNIYTAASPRWEWNNSGHFLAVADNTYDIGASGATRPRSVYVGTNVQAGGEGIFTGNVSTDGVFRDLSTGNRVDLSVSTGARIANNGATNTYDITLADWGTTLSAEAVPLADAGTVNLGAAFSGSCTVSYPADAAIYVLRGTSNATRLADGSAMFTTTKDNAGTINLYFDTTAYFLQNMTGGALSFRIACIGG